MTPREHFKDLDAVYINLEKDVDRKRQVLENCGGLFKTFVRVEPVKYDDMRQKGLEVKKNLEKTAKLFDPKDYLKTCYMYKEVSEKAFMNRKSRKDKLEMTWLPEQYAAHNSLTDTVLNILDDFLGSDKQKLVVVEDDAYPRDFLDIDLDIPDADIIVWGGASRGVVSDAVAVRDGKSFEFKKKTGKGTANYTTCWEVTRRGAIALVRAYDRPAVTIDTAWRYAFDVVDSYALFPMGFVQRFGSSSTDGAFEMPLTVEEARIFIEKNRRKKKGETYNG